MVKQLQVTIVIRLSICDFHHLMVFTYEVPKQHLKCFYSYAQTHTELCEKCTWSSVFLPELSHAANAYPMIYLLPCLNFMHLEQFYCLK